MYSNGINYRLTKHGRKMYLKRVGQASDTEMLNIAITGLPGYKFIWKDDRSCRLSKRLVTVLVWQK